MGYSLREFEREVPPANREFHVMAEQLLLYKEGVLPLDPDDAETPGADVDADVDTPDASATPGSKRIRQ